MPRGRRLTNADEVVASPDAREAARRLAALEGTFVAVDAAGVRVDLPEELARLLRRASQEIAAGHNITILRSDEVLTPNEAAEVLGVSRQYLTRLLDDGRIPAETLADSSHRRVRLADVLDFQAERERRREGIAEFRRAVADAEATEATYRRTSVEPPAQ
jgi:excisionase family DNA binding protein